MKCICHRRVYFVTAGYRRGQKCARLPLIPVASTDCFTTGPGQSKATYATLSKSEFTNLANETTESYDFTLSTIDNPYPRENSDDLCNGPCAREQVCDTKHLRAVQ